MNKLKRHLILFRDTRSVISFMTDEMEKILQAGWKHKVTRRNQFHFEIELLNSLFVVRPCLDERLLRGVECDEIVFKFTPDPEMLMIAKSRVMKNKGRVFVHSEMVYPV